MLFQTGDPCPGVYVVHEGSVQLRHTSATGKSHLLRAVGPASSLAEAVVIADFRCPVTAVAAEDSVLCELPAEALRELVEREHGVCLALLRAMANRQRKVVLHTQNIVLRDALGRVAAYLCERLGHGEDDLQPRLGELRLTLLKRDLAEHLNIKSETLSRLLRRLREDGVIATEAGTLRVLDLAALRKLAE